MNIKDKLTLTIEDTYNWNTDNPSEYNWMDDNWEQQYE